MSESGGVLLFIERVLKNAFFFVLFVSILSSFNVASATFAQEENAEASKNADPNRSASEFDFGDPENWPRLDGPSDSALRFRVDNVVRFTENEREIALKTSTVFCDDLAFDFIGDNGEITVYSFAAQKFVLIDPIRRMQTEIKVSEIDRFFEKIKPRLREKENKFYDFILSPEFDVSQKDAELLFQSKWIDYRATTQILDSPNLRDAYYQFVNDLSKLNVFINPGVLTPFARLKINQYFAEESRFPEKIVVDFYPKGKMFFNKSIQVRNEHKIALRLSEKDRNRITRAIHFAAQFPKVDFQTYYRKLNER